MGLSNESSLSEEEKQKNRYRNRWRREVTKLLKTGQQFADLRRGQKRRKMSKATRRTFRAFDLSNNPNDERYYLFEYSLTLGESDANDLMGE